MSYAAIIARIRTRPFPNADRLLLGDVEGHQVVVGKDTQDGELGIFFPEGGQLSEAFVEANKLHKKDGGMFDDKRRVKAIRLRGEMSEGLWVPLSYLCHAADCSLVHAAMNEGEQLTEFKGIEICRKYITPATQRTIDAALRQGDQKAAKRMQALPRHYDTGQLRYGHRSVPEGAWLVWTEKLHGTSGRTGKVLVDAPLGFVARTLNRVLPKALQIKPRKQWEVVSGTRNCILDAGAQGEKGKGYRQQWHDRIAPHLLAGEVVYYEIVGYEDSGRPIMPPHGDVVYHYGQAPGTSGAYIYRITQDGRDLVWPEVQDRAHMIGIPTVPVLDEGEHFDQDILGAAKTLCLSGSTFGSAVMEGVCLRVEVFDKEAREWRVKPSMKYKSFRFCELEGIRANDDGLVDTEEVA